MNLSSLSGVAAALLLLTRVAQAQSNDEAQANSYDNAWKTGWVDHCRTIYSTTGKTAGFVLEIGDSITWSTAYAEWPRQGTSSATSDTPKDADVFAWAMTTNWTGTNTDTTPKNGWFLSSENTTADRSMTAAGGITAVQYLSGTGNGPSGSLTMPTDTAASAADTDLVNTSIVYNLQINTVAAAFGDAQAAVVMLGTNDANEADGTAAFASALSSIVGVLEAKNIVVVLSTIPPSTQFDVTPYNAQIRGFAQSHGLPLIDFYAEILARQPVHWSPNLINSGDGIHPTASGTGPSGTAWTASSDPYAQGGNPATNATGEACTVVGYLLRSWLTIQKLKEVYSYVAQGNNPPVPPSSSGSSGGGGSGDGGGGGGGCGATGLESLVILGGVLALGRRRSFVRARRA